MAVTLEKLVTAPEFLELDEIDRRSTVDNFFRQKSEEYNTLDDADKGLTVDNVMSKFDLVEKPWAVTRGLVTTLLQNNPQLMGETAEALGHLTGIDTLREIGNKYKAFSPEAAKKYKPSGIRLSEVNDLTKALTWAGEQFGSGLGSMAPSLVTGTAGFAVAGVPGATVGATMGSLPLNYGDMYRSLKEEGAPADVAAKVAGLPAAMITALDVASLGGITKTATQGVKNQITKSVAKRLAAAALKGGTWEGVTEGLQQTIQEATLEVMHPGKVPLAERAERVLESGAGGFLVGGVVASPGGLATPKSEPPAAPKPAPTPQAVAPAPQPAPTAVTAPVAIEPAVQAPIPPTPVTPTPRREEVTIPETGEVEQTENVLTEIRNANARTRGDIQALFPKAQLTREQAGRLRRQAWPETQVLESQGVRTEEVAPVEPATPTPVKPAAAPAPTVPAVAPTIAPAEGKAVEPPTPAKPVSAPEAKPEVVAPIQPVTPAEPVEAAKPPIEWPKEARLKGSPKFYPARTDNKGLFVILKNGKETVPSSKSVAEIRNAPNLPTVGETPTPAIGETPKAKEPWEMKVTGKEWADLPIEEIDRAAFGFSPEDIKTISPEKLNVKYKGDMGNPIAAQKKSGLSPKEWAKTINLSEPIQLSYEKGKIWIEDGHHRYYAAKILGKKLKVDDVNIKDKPHRKIIEDALSEGKPVPSEVLADYPDLVKKAEKPVTPSPIETVSGGISDRILSVLDTVENQARAELAKLRKPVTLGMAKPLGIASQHIIIGMVKLARGTVKYVQWSAAMVKEFGHQIRPHLRAIYEKAQTLLDEVNAGMNEKVIQTRARELEVEIAKPAKVTKEAVKEFAEGRPTPEKTITEPQALKTLFQRVQKFSKQIARGTLAQRRVIMRQVVSLVEQLPKQWRTKYLKAVANAGSPATVASILKRLEVDMEQSTALKTARAAVETQIETKELQKVENLIQAMKLPPIESMTVDQLQQLDAALKPFKTGDEFLPVRQLETIDRTVLKGIRTVREAQEYLAKQYGLTREQLLATAQPSAGILETMRDVWSKEGLLSALGSAVREILNGVKRDIPILKPHPWMYDTQLAREHPLFDLLVDRYNEAYLKSAARVIELTAEIDKLINVARTSRRRGVGQRLIPTDAKIMQWLESEKREEVAKDMTPEELAAARRMDEVFGEYYAWLAQREADKKFGSRFEDKYYPHVRRGFLEAWKENGFLTALIEFKDQFKQDEKLLTILDQKTGNILPYQKWVGFAQFRTGKLVPTSNAARAFEAYVTAIEKAKQFDEFIPEIMVYVHTLTPKGMTERGVMLNDSLQRFVKSWINAKKGRVPEQMVKAGSKTDVALRIGIALTRLRDLGLNIPIGIANMLGEQAGNIAMLRMAWLKGAGRMVTPQGRRIALKYENFVGRSLWDALTRASNHAGDKFFAGIFGLFSESNRRSNELFLLGSMTDAEYTSGEISPARLAQLRKRMGRYRVVEGAESIFGKSVEGAAGGQYKKWAIPILVTLASNTKILAGKLRKQGLSALKSEEGAELFWSVGLASVLGMGIMGYYHELEKDKGRNFMEEIIYKSARESLTMIGVLQPKFIASFSAPRLAQLILDLGEAADMILKWEKTKKTGELKGVQKLVKTVTPVAVKPFIEEGKPKK